MNDRIMIVEDEDTLRESLCRVFEREGYEVAAVSTAENALERFGEEAFDLVITDIILPGITGIELIKRMREAAPDQSCIVMTAYASLETAVETLRVGAYDYIVKPIIHEEIKQTVRNALKMRALQEENALLKGEAADSYGVERIVGDHPEIAAIRKGLKSLGENRAPVLVEGEVGTGKRLVSKVIHHSGFPARFPLHEIDCRRLSSVEQEKLLFGAPPGAAHDASGGMLQKAEKGTVCVNGIEALSRENQKRLLDVLVERQIRFPSGAGAVKVEALVLAGTEKDLGSLAAAGAFEEGLFRKLESSRIRLPPLRNRGGDLELLTDLFVGRYSECFDKQVKGPTPDVRRMLRAYSWPGNVLELRNVLERAVLLCSNDWLQPADFPPLS